MKPPYTLTDTKQGEIPALAEQIGLNRYLIGILRARGYDTPEKIDAFLHPRVSGLNSPFLMAGMFQAVDRIKAALVSRERIGIFADSDLDGITALAVFHTLLAKFDLQPFIRYLKDDETYGLTREIVDEFHANGVSLLITVDSGIRDIAEIAHARSLGIDVIVSDHHEQDTDLPDAIIVNPKAKACGYPFKHLAGVGIAFKICHALLLSYLPSFNRLFVIVSNAGGMYHASFVRNCIVEKIMTEADPSAIIAGLLALDENDFVLLHEINDSAGMQFTSVRARMYQLREFITSLLKPGGSSWDQMFAGFRNGKKYALRQADTLNDMFIEAQLAVPGKINEFMRTVLGLVAIGSIADVMPLIDENRILVKIGIEELNKRKHPAIALLSRDMKINSKIIGWSIAPLLNTPGRLGKTGLTVDFFTENDPARLQDILSEINELNDSRKSVISQLHSKLMGDREIAKMMENEKIIYIKTDEIHDGYAGLIANRMADNTHKPVILVVLPGKKGIVKGSCRVKSGAHFFSHVRQFSGMFEKIGGHENAFGFTAKANLIDDIIRSIADSYKEEIAVSGRPPVDAELDISQISVNFIRELEILEPYGNLNPEPVFISRGTLFETCSIFGNNHGKFLLSGNSAVSAIGWGIGSIMKDYFSSGRPLDLVYRLENNEFRGSVNPRMIVLDLEYSR